MPTGTDNKATYQDITRDDAMNLTDHVTHASHVMLYAPVPEKLFGRYDMKYTVMVRVWCVHVCVYQLCVNLHSGTDEI